MGKWKPGDPPPKAINHDLMQRIFEAAGWTKEIGGKHSTKMVKAGRRPVTIPRHSNRDFGPRLRNSILKEGELDR